MGHSQDSSREGQSMEKTVFIFEKGRDYIAKERDADGKIKVHKLHCSQCHGYHSAHEMPVFNNGNRMVHVCDFDRIKADNETLEVETAIVRIFRNHDWSKDLEVLAFPVDMPKFEYENNQNKVR